MKRFFVAFLTFVCCALPVRSQDHAEDVVLLRDGNTQSLTIEAENWDALSGRGSPPIPWDRVESIEYADSEELTKASEAFKAGRYDAALEQLGALKADPKLRKVFKQQAAFLTALALDASGKPDQAIAGYQDVIKTYPKGRYHVRASQALVDALLAKKDGAGADKAIDGLIADAGSDASLVAALNLVKARSLRSQGRATDAKPLFNLAASATTAPAWVALEGRLGVATALIQDKPEEALQRLRELTKTDAPRNVLAGAWNGLGDLYSAQAKAKSDIDQMLDALFCYLRGTTVYAPLAGEPTDQYERSCWGSIVCFKFVSDLERNAEKKKLYKQRHDERLEQFKKEFPSSTYLKN